MYLLYPLNSGGYSIFEIPAGQTAEELATSFGLTMAVCAEFDMATFGSDAAYYPTSFSLVDNQPEPNGAYFDLDSAKVTAKGTRKSKVSRQQTLELRGYGIEAIAAQAALAQVDRISELDDILGDINTLNESLQISLAAIDAAPDIETVQNIVNLP